MAQTHPSRAQQDSEGLEVASQPSPTADSEGLQALHPHAAWSHGLEVSHPEPVWSPGLEAVTPGKRILSNSGDEGLQVYRKADIEDEPPTYLLTVPEKQKPSRFGRKRWWLAVGALVLIVLAAILGGVLGTQASRKATSNSEGTGISSSSSSSPTFDPASTSPSESSSTVKQSLGVKAGSSLSADINYAVGGGNRSNGGYLFFQADNGTVTLLSYGYDNSTGLISLTHANNIDIDAANGTTLSGRVWNHWGVTYFLQLIYIAQNGTLCDVTLGTELNTQWKPGNLSSINFQTTIEAGRRVGMHHQISYIYGKDGDNAPGGSRLWVGGSDGVIHMMAYDFASGTWSSPPQVFSDIPATSSIDSAYGGGFDAGWLALFSANKDNTLAYRQQNFTGLQNGGRLWPNGGPYDDPVSIPQTAANGSFAVEWPFLFFERTDGKLGVQDLSLADQHWGDYSSALEKPLPIMSGTDFDSTSIDEHIQFFYQDNSSSIAWRVMEGTTQGGSGHFVLDVGSGQWQDSQ